MANSIIPGLDKPETSATKAPRPKEKIVIIINLGVLAAKIFFQVSPSQT
jgi:hypothetical protein